jgi:hypothetical protein
MRAANSETLVNDETLDGLISTSSDGATLLLPICRPVRYSVPGHEPVTPLAGAFWLRQAASEDRAS